MTNVISLINLGFGFKIQYKLFPILKLVFFPTYYVLNRST